MAVKVVALVEVVEWIKQRWWHWGSEGDVSMVVEAEAEAKVG